MDHQWQERTSPGNPLRSRLPRISKSATPSDERGILIRIMDLRDQLQEEIRTASQDIKKRIVTILLFQSLCFQIILLQWDEKSWNMVYVSVDFPDILRLNEEACLDTTRMVAIKEAVGLLFKYGVNLMKPEVSTSTAWRVISFDNTLYTSKVRVLKGHKQILYLYGYTKEMSYGLSFPDALHIPNANTVAKVVADLAIAYFEIDMYIKGSHPYPHRIGMLIQSAASRTQTLPNIDKHTVSSGYCSYSSDSLDLEENSQESTLQDVRNADSPLVRNNYHSPQEPEVFPNTVAAQTRQEKQLHSEQKQARQIGLQSSSSKSPSSKSPPLYSQEIKLTKCGICKQNTANMRCNICSQPRCVRCDELWHKHPQRQGHTRHLIIPEELEAPGMLQPVADISQRHPEAAASKPVIDKSTSRETHLPEGSSPKTPGLFTLPEVSIEETSASSRANDLPDSPKLQHGLELKADVPVVICDFCSNKPGKKFCPSCDDTYCLECDEKRHNNPRRKDHKRQDVTQVTQPGNTSSVETMGPDQEPLELSKDVTLPSYICSTQPNTCTDETDNQKLDSFMSTYYSVATAPDDIYINSEEPLDVRAPPNDTYRQPMEKTSLGSGASKAQGYKSSDFIEESPYMLAPALRDGGMAPQNTSGGTNDSKLQAKQDEITAEDIAIMETLISVRDLKKHETDPVKRAKLVQEEQILTQKHEDLVKRLEELQGRQSGMPRASSQGAAVASPRKVTAGAAVPTGAGMAVPQGKVLSPATSAGTMSVSTNLPQIRQQIPGSSKAPRQEPRDILQGSQEEGWICQHCTFLNTNVKSNICEICDKTSFPKAKIQPTVRPKETRLEQSNFDSEVKVKPTTKEERRKKNAEYYQKLEAEMLAEKQQAKEAYSGNVRPYPEPTIKEPKTTVEKSKPLSDTDLLELAQEIPSSHFIKLGIELGFSPDEISRLRVRDPTGIIGGSTFEMLKMWRGDVRGIEQRPKLKQVLSNAGLRPLTHVIDENRFIQDEPRVSSPKIKTMHSSSTLPRRTSTSSAPPTPDGVSDEELLELSRMIPLDKIHDLGFNLRLSYLKVQSYLHMHRGDAVDVILHMLQNWKSRTIRSDQRRELNRILIDCDLGGLTLSEVSSKPKVESRGITDMELYELADSLNAENITQLGVYLGFSMAEISRYQHDAVMESPREGTMRMLQDWKNHQPEKGQRDILSNVLDQIGCNHLGAAIRNPTGFTGHDNFEESLHQRPLSHATSFGDLSYVKDEEKMRYEEMSIASLKRIAELREAESQNIPVERIKCALYVMEENGDDVTNPIEWIAHNWTDVIQELAHKATQELRENLEVDVDAKIMELVQVSAESAEKCLEDCSGDMQEAVKECTQRAQEKILEIKEIGCYSVEDIVAILKQDDVQGDVEKALEALQVKAMAEYVDRVWTPTTNGDDNEYFQQAIKIDDRSIRMLMVEYNMRSWGRAQTAAKLIVRNEFDVDDVVIAAEECGDLRRSEVFLKQECSVCYIELPRNKLMSLINCQCMMCRECVTEHFGLIARDQSIMKGKCPSCDQPNLDDPAVAADYFAFLDILLRDMLTPEVYELFQRKLRDWNLMQDKNFCWCAHCNSGFINGAPDRRKMRCPECNKLTCFNCKKQWMDQHEGISCEAFQQWKENNDPDLQAQGLAAHLNENGIECPRCKMRYELAKGGCMHFKCPQCTFEFCCGCNEPMKKGDACTKFESCWRKGLHAHHPRDCLFYLRDEKITFLQKLLDDANVEYNKEPPEGAEENEEGVCGVKEQKDGPNGLEDDKCGRKVTPGNAGLCRIHYIEYLVGLINSKKIDPAKSFPINQLEAILTREEIPIPVRRPDEADPDYRKRLLAEVKTKLPLKKSTRDRAR